MLRTVEEKRKKGSHPKLDDEAKLALAASLRAHRQRRDMTLSDLSKATGMTLQHLHQLETVGGNITLGTLYALASALRVSARSLLPK